MLNLHQPHGTRRIPNYMLNLHQPDGTRRISNDNSSYKDWSCWTGLHPPSKADALCAISPRAPRLRVHRTGSRGGAKARRAGAQRSHGRLDGAAPVAGSGRLAWQGGPGQGAIYLRTVINPVEPAQAGFALESRGQSPAARSECRFIFLIFITRGTTRRSCSSVIRVQAVEPDDVAPSTFRQWNRTTSRPPRRSTMS